MKTYSLWILSRLAGRCSAIAVAVLLVLNATTAFAQQQDVSPATMRLLAEIAEEKWTVGPAECQIGTMAKINIPSGQRFIGARGAQALIELYGNPPNPNYLGAIVPISDDEDWTLLFQFDAIGYVKDEEKDSLNGDNILQSMRDTIPYQNEERRRLGLEEMRSMSWSAPPFYDPVTNNLTWGLQLHFDTGDSINYDIRLLGRHGVMEVTLLDSPETYAQSVPTVNELLKSFEFTDGNKYAEWKAGDKVAAYGLTGLVAGGATVMAAKTGLLGKLLAVIAKGGKAVFAIIIAVVLGLGSIVKRMFGGGGDKAQTAE